MSKLCDDVTNKQTNNLSSLEKFKKNKNKIKNWEYIIKQYYVLYQNVQ